MKRLHIVLVLALASFLPLLALAQAADQAPTAATAGNGVDSATAAAAALGLGVVPPGQYAPPAILERLVDSLLAIFDVRSNGNTAVHYSIAAFLVLAGLLLRRILTTVVFSVLKKMVARTKTTFDDKLLPALESPAATFVMLVGIFAGLDVLKLDPALDIAVARGSTVAFSVVLLWGFLSALGAILDHAHELAQAKGSGVAAFMPWIKKALITIFVVFGVLMVAKSLGADVGAALAGLGLGGLAFALAAQDTIANVFGSIVVAIDQPFRIGDNIRINGNVGTVEDIGLRSTRLRLQDKSLMVIPNKAVAGEYITNLSRFTGRRVEQVIGLTYDTHPEQIDEIVADIRRILASESEVKQETVHVFFRDLSASSLDIWMTYETSDPQHQESLGTRQRVNLGIMRAVESRGLAFAYPTQTLHLGGDVVRRLAGGDPKSP